MRFFLRSVLSQHMTGTLACQQNMTPDANVGQFSGEWRRAIFSKLYVAGEMHLSLCHPRKETHSFQALSGTPAANKSDAQACTSGQASLA